MEAGGGKDDPEGLGAGERLEVGGRARLEVVDAAGAEREAELEAALAVELVGVEAQRVVERTRRLRTPAPRRPPPPRSRRRSRARRSARAAGRVY
jgi:hypothetical protein